MWKSITSGRWSEASRASREWAIRACRTVSPPRVNALSSAVTGKYAGNDRNRDRGAGQLAESLRAQDLRAEGVPPVVEVSHDQGRVVARLTEQSMLQEMLGLPSTLLLGQPEMPVDQVQRPFGRGHDEHLGAPRLPPLEPQRHLVVGLKRPPREHQIAVPPFLQLDVELIQMVRRTERLDELSRLVVVPRPRHLAVDLLKTDQVRVLPLDHLDHALETIPTVAPADPLVDIVTE